MTKTLQGYCIRSVSFGASVLIALQFLLAASVLAKSFPTYKDSLPPTVSEAIRDSMLAIRASVLVLPTTCDTTKSARKLLIYKIRANNESGHVDINLAWPQGETIECAQYAERLLRRLYDSSAFVRNALQKYGAGYHPVRLITEEMKGEFSWVYYVAGYGSDAPIVDPLSVPIPVYPPEALSKFAEGSVSFKVIVDTLGHVSKLKAIESSSYNYNFVKPAATALLQATFPVKEGDSQPTSYDCYTTIHFQLARRQVSSDNLPPIDSFIYVDSIPSLLVSVKPDVPLAQPGDSDIIKVVYAAFVDIDGRVARVEIYQSSGDAELDSLTLAVVQLNQYRPAYLENKPIGSWVKSQIGYKSDREEIPGVDDFVVLEELPQMVREARAEYPHYAKEHSQEGAVWIAVLLNPRGVITEVKLYKTSGYPLLDKAAMDAAWKYVFTAGLRNGKPVYCWVKYKVAFRLGN